MPRTFSLARLLLGITAVCILCGLAVNFPRAALLCVFGLVFFAPTVTVVLVMRRFSTRPGTLTVACVLGAFAGWLVLAPAAIYVLVSVFDAFVPLTIFGGDYLFDAALFAAAAAGPALGALLFSSAALLGDRTSPRQPTSADECLDQDREIHRLLRH